MSTASIRDADEREFMHMQAHGGVRMWCGSQVPPLKRRGLQPRGLEMGRRSRHREDVPYKDLECEVSLTRVAGSLGQHPE